MVTTKISEAGEVWGHSNRVGSLLGFVLFVSVPVACYDFNVASLTCALLNSSSWYFDLRWRVALRAHDFVLLYTYTLEVNLVLLEKQLLFLSKIGVLAVLFNLLDLFFETIPVKVRRHS